MKHSKQPYDHQSKSRRAAKTWAKESSLKEHFKKRRYDDVDKESDEAVPLSAISMTPRLKTIQAKIRLDEAELLEGQVIDSTGRSWIVALAAEPTRTTSENNGWHEHRYHKRYAYHQPLYDCVVTRSVVTDNPASTLVAVGDIVKFKPDEQSGTSEGLPTGAIYAVGRRKTKLARTAAGRDGIEQVIVSNVEQLVILMAAADPFYNRRLIDRYLIAAEQGGLAPVLCINKIDLMDKDFVRNDTIVYAEQLSMPVLLVSAISGAGIKELQSILRHKISVFSGPSGVGKSTLVNLLLGREVQATTAVNQRTQRGAHTTTFSELFTLPFGGFIADTPGIREFGIWDVSREELSFFFHDFDEYRHECRFAACTHTHEPDCAVKAAVERGAVDAQRYESYLNILETLPA